MRKKPDTLEGRGAGLGYDARALENPWPGKSLLLWSAKTAKVTLKRLVGQGGLLFIHHVLGQPT